MGLFAFGNKKQKEIKTACACGSQCGLNDAKDARIIVLGSCCKKSTDTFNNVILAAKEIGLVDHVVNIGEHVEIAKYGVMQTPALVLNNKVVSYGKLISVAQATELLLKAGLTE